MSTATYDLTGKVVLITGGNGGIGAATGRELLTRGARLVVADVDPETPRRVAALDSDRAIGCVADVRDQSSLDRAVARAVDRFGGLDIVVANAGLLVEAATLRNTPVTDVATTLAVNVMGVVHTVAAGMEEVIRNRGQVVLISSVYAFINGMGNIPYAMSKAAVEQLGRGLRIELADHGASVLTAYFSFVDTHMIHHRVDSDDVLTELFGSLPKPLVARISPATAAIAIADGLQQRSPRVISPARWRPLSGLRGLLGPAVDAHFARNRRTLDILAQLDGRVHSHADSNGTLI
ncbi:SDR family NAD(P)-dependent oxidoreductase [Mycolicibacterium vinylchloridicum]|uniref:SDR family NAD(P)-dependent oxidoreductase n=1 Tax=Mycolicibacterium vinylchloridicum TaxID=2736928 RepID=UPI0015CAAA90|nr:SDR family NAD(P)-dependent oxidoreductase [Mycolicibacterium vinylchloridicum]